MRERNTELFMRESDAKKRHRECLVTLIFETIRPYEPDPMQSFPLLTQEQQWVPAWLVDKPTID